MNETDVFELIGERIKLVKTKSEDIAKIIEFEKLNSRFVHNYPKDKHLELLKDNDCFHFSIKRLDNDELIGHAILFGKESIHKVLGLKRITINEKGFGYGREAIKLIKQLCFEKLKFHRLWLDVYDDNERAIKLYESEGFTKEGILRENIKVNEDYRSQRIYSMLEYEYK